MRLRTLKLSNQRLQSTKMKIRKLWYRFRCWLCKDILHEEWVQAMHPEFGSEWQEPDGELYKAYIRGLEDGRAQALREYEK